MIFTRQPDDQWACRFLTAAPRTSEKNQTPLSESPSSLEKGEGHVPRSHLVSSMRTFWSPPLQRTVMESEPPPGKKMPPTSSDCPHTSGLQDFYRMDYSGVKGIQGDQYVPLQNDLER
ncbi:hypothetical protein HispidOSU_003808 [Sigmodon hispidus]